MAADGFIDTFVTNYNSMFGTQPIKYSVDGGMVFLGTLSLFTGVVIYYNAMECMLMDTPYQFSGYSTIPTHHYPYLAEIYGEFADALARWPSLKLKM